MHKKPKYCENSVSGIIDCAFASLCLISVELTSRLSHFNVLPYKNLTKSCCTLGGARASLAPFPGLANYYIVSSYFRLVFPTSDSAKLS